MPARRYAIQDNRRRLPRVYKRAWSDFPTSAVLN
jgi:hypothetical protein